MHVNIIANTTPTNAYQFLVDQEYGGGRDALATADAAVCVGGSRLTEVTEEAMEAAKVTQLKEATVAETLWPLLMLVSVSVEPD